MNSKSTFVTVAVLIGLWQAPCLHSASTVEFAKPLAITVLENAGEAVLTVLRAGDVDSTVTVDYATLDSSAKAGSDYQVSAGTLTFEAGQTNHTIRILILNDALPEGRFERFSVSLANPSANATLGTALTAVVTITDNDPGIQVEFAQYWVEEGSETVAIGVTRGPDDNSPATVKYATSDATAKAGPDYEAATGTIEFGATEKLKLVVIRILNDAVREGTETFTFTLSNPTGATALGKKSAMITIEDNDPGIQVEFARYWADEGSGTVTVGVVRGPDEAFVATVDYATSDASAKAGTDYQAVGGTLTFAADEKLKLVDIPILNDGLSETGETFRLAISNPGGGAVLGAIRNATITITDNDPGVQFAVNQHWVQEDESALELTVMRGNDLQLEAFTVDYVTKELTATAGQDYVATAGRLDFGAGELTKTLSVPILYDNAPEVDEQFRIVLSNPTGGMVLGPGTNITATVTVCDATGIEPHGFRGLAVLADRSVALDLAGGLHQRFLGFYDLYPLEASVNLRDWTALRTIPRLVSPGGVYVDTEAGAGEDSQRFYRVPSRHFITPYAPPSGPYAVGRIDRWLSDPTRRNRFFISTNNSFQVAVWYPARPRASSWPLPWTDGPALRGLDYNSGWMDRGPQVMSYAAGNLDLAPGPVRFPVMLISPGGGDVRHGLDEKACEIASHGFVVAATDHPDAYGVVLPDGTSVTVPFNNVGDWWFQDRVSDLRFIVDQLEQWNSSDSFFAGRLDLAGVAALGFSWGGGVVAEFCRVDPRGKAAVVLEGYFQMADTVLATGLSKPVLSVYRSDAYADQLFDKLTRDAVWFQVSDTQHGHIAGWGYVYSGTPQSLVSSREVNRTVDAYVVWFMNKHLKGVDEPMPDPASYPRLFNLQQK